MSGSRRAGKTTATAITLVGVVGAMVGLAFASVPLYRLFCQVTGYGGTPKTENVAHSAAANGETIKVRFDANVNPKLPWRFRPAQRQVTVRLGEERLIRYVAVNRSNVPITGTAVFSVSPYKAAQYFNKVECFCFTEQTLKPGEEVSMPVMFYVDPEIRNDPNARDVKTVTLSYTFYRANEDDGQQRQDSPPKTEQAARPGS